MGTDPSASQNLSKTVLPCNEEGLAILLSAKLRSCQQTSLGPSPKYSVHKEGVVLIVVFSSAFLLGISSAILLHPLGTPRIPFSVGEINTDFFWFITRPRAFGKLML